MNGLRTPVATSPRLPSLRDADQPALRIDEKPTVTVDIPEIDTPSDLTRFIGRRKESADVRSLLGTAHLVTLIGTGGVGKTRLALRSARGSRRAFPGGVHFVQLEQVRDQAQLTNAVAAALGCASSVDSMSQLALILGSQRTLLVLDSCDHLTGDAVSAVTSLLQSCPHARVLATSRQPLGVCGEAVLPIDPLPYPIAGSAPSLMPTESCGAIALFADRARAAIPTFELTDDNRDSVAKICQMLDGLPLAIELAAAKLRSMSVQQIRARLTDPFSILVSGNRAAPQRQQTLHKCIAWSYALCTPREQTLWNRLSVFTGSFDLEAAHEICASEWSPDEVMDVVAALVDKSVLIREGDASVRYRMLTVLRHYGRQELRYCGDLMAYQRKHRQWYQDLALRADADWNSPSQSSWIERLSHEQDNLRGALLGSLAEPSESEALLRTTYALHRFWIACGQFGECRSWLSKALAQSQGLFSIRRVAALCANGVVVAGFGDLAEATALVDEARQLCEEHVPSKDAHHLLSYAEGFVALLSNNFGSATECFKSALDDHRSSRERIELLFGLALSTGLGGDIRQAVTHLERGLSLATADNLLAEQCYLLWALGFALWQTHPDKATEALEKCLRLLRGTQLPLAGACVETLAWIAGAGRSGQHGGVLLGAAARLRTSMGQSLGSLPGIEEHHEKCRDLMTCTLGEQPANAAIQRGRNFTCEEAIAYALSEKPPERTCPVTDPRTTLTRREREVSELVARGLTNRSIADQLVISLRTAQGHVEHILAKLGYTSRAQIAAWVVECQ
ncbi:ATP-binding protein [Rhodococcus sp. NPDC059968]|uniref:ATP-binding protein n=1 Tax=Rhodococcus sp. NPDC059968 TaxID=3347017 RepID=UPI00366FA09C